MNTEQTPPPDSLGSPSCCASWIEGPPIELGKSYVVLWDNGGSSVEWVWTSANAHLAVGHLPIPARPNLDYEPCAYRDCDNRGWVGKYSWHNAQEHRP